MRKEEGAEQAALCPSLSSKSGDILEGAFILWLLELNPPNETEQGNGTVELKTTTKCRPRVAVFCGPAEALPTASWAASLLLTRLVVASASDASPAAESDELLLLGMYLPQAGSSPNPQGHNTEGDCHLHFTDLKTEAHGRPFERMRLKSYLLVC